MIDRSRGTMPSSGDRTGSSPMATTTPSPRRCRPGAPTGSSGVETRPWPRSGRCRCRSHASERVFGNKYSFAAIDAARYQRGVRGGAGKVASGFFNDLFWFDQMACSSPHVVFWIGAPGSGGVGARTTSSGRSRPRLPAGSSSHRCRARYTGAPTPSASRPRPTSGWC